MVVVPGVAGLGAPPAGGADPSVGLDEVGLDDGVWPQATLHGSMLGQSRKTARAMGRTGGSRTSSFPLGPTSCLEEPLGHKDDVVGLQRDVFILVRSPQHLINIYAHPLPVFPLAPEDIYPASGGHRGEAPPLSKGLD